MTYRDASAIESWHAHVYFNAATREAAWTLREAIEAQLGDQIQLGRFHERPVGPHPMWSYQLAIEPAQFAPVFAWLTLNRGELNVFLHPNTGNALRDHRDAAVWIGRSYSLVLDVFNA
jgi:aromatic ring-cleaving dioxygenase